MIAGRNCPPRLNGGPVATRTPDLYRVKVALYRDAAASPDKLP